MSLLRRRAMMENQEKDEWDIKLFPDDTGDIVGLYRPQAYGAYFAKGTTTLDRSTLFSDSDSVGKGVSMSLGGNRFLTERVAVNYLYLKWVY